uniref:Phosphatidylinositol-glycan biosynthesis class X protein n=1 Tax=Echinococcus granulosus TaxID=6210 RepID=A0A068W8S8_ECHGR|nr:DEAD box ATP dependent RNA helicase [Echinococcus granulosus]
MRKLMRVQVIFAIFLVLTLADDPGKSLFTYFCKALQRNIVCDLEQRALHLRLRCSLTPTTSGAWDQCSVNVDLARGIYANPYELADKLPEVKFTIARKATREAGRLSRFFFSKKSVESESRQEISLNASEVDIEAPSWKSEPTRWKFALDSQRQIWGSNAAIELSIPLHLRYNLPSRSGKPGGHLALGLLFRPLIGDATYSHFTGHWNYYPSSSLAASTLGFAHTRLSHLHISGNHHWCLHVCECVKAQENKNHTYMAFPSMNFYILAGFQVKTWQTVALSSPKGLDDLGTQTFWNVRYRNNPLT